MEMLKNTIDTLFPVYLDFWKTICRMETPSNDRDALNAQADFIESFATARGFSVRRCAHPNAGDTLAVELAGDHRDPVVLLAHMDTVHLPGAFGEEVVREENGILYGPGVFDCKGGIALALMAMEALKHSGASHRKIKLILNSDEENGSFVGQAGVDFIQNEARGACAAFNAEAGRKGLLTVGRKGIMAAEIRIQGVAAHAGNAYFSGASAVREAAYKIIDLESQSQGDVTFNCGVIHGGSVRNIVPDSCTIELDVRFSNPAQREQAIAIVEAAVQKTHVEGCTADWRIIKIRPAMECTPGNLELFDKICQKAAELGMPPFASQVVGGGSDSAFTVEIGIPTVCSMGPAGMYEHTVREQADIASLPRRALLMAECILAV